MKLLLSIALLPFVSFADDPVLAENIARHQVGARELSDRQDELAADVQQLTIEQTEQEVIDLFREVENLMDEASERLFEHDTGGETLSAETEVIEKIYAAAKARQKSSSGGKAGSAMMEMMERMLGMEPAPGGKPGGEPSEQGDGEGMTGDSDAANADVGGTSGGRIEERRVPKGAGIAGKSLPREFQDALKAYNLGAAPLAK